MNIYMLLKTPMITDRSWMVITTLWPMFTLTHSLRYLSFSSEVNAPGPDNIHNEVLRLGIITSLFHHLARGFLPPPYK